MQTLQERIAELEKRFGPQVVRLCSADYPKIEVIPSGIPQLDLITGAGGIPRGRVTELYGPEGAGKSTVALHCAAQAQRMGLDVVYIDTEAALNFKWAQKIGVNLDALWHSQPASMEEMLEIAKAVAVPSTGLIIMDSIAAAAPAAELDSQFADQHVGIKARLLGKFFRQMQPYQESNTAMLCINQVREMIGVMYGSNETTPGGHGFKHATSLRIRMLKRGSKTQSVGGRDTYIHAATVYKNKVGVPHQSTDLLMTADAGIDVVWSLLGAGRQLGVLKNSKGTPAASITTPLFFDGMALGNSAEAWKYLWDNPEVQQALSDAVYEAINK